MLFREREGKREKERELNQLLETETEGHVGDRKNIWIQKER